MLCYFIVAPRKSTRQSDALPDLTQEHGVRKPLLQKWMTGKNNINNRLCTVSPKLNRLDRKSLVRQKLACL